MKPIMPSHPISWFLVAGFLFGLLTYSRRRLFGEGPPDQHVDPQDGLQGPVFWVAICIFLWPVLIISGLHGLCRVYSASKRK
jgi:hypothetical protein